MDHPSHSLFDAFYAAALSCLLTCASAGAGEANQIRDGFQPFWAGPTLDIVKTDAPESPREAFLSPGATVIHKESQVPSFGYTSQSYAARLRLTNATDHPVGVHLVVYGPIEKVFLAHVSGLSVRSEAAEGMFMSPTTADSHLLFRYPQFEIKLAPGPNEVFFGENAIAPHFPIQVMTDEDYDRFAVSELMKVSGFLAVCSLILLAALTITVASPERTFTLYTLAFGFAFLLNIFITGALRPALYQLLGKDGFALATQIDLFINHYWIVWMALCEIFQTLFGLHFLKVDIRDRSWTSRCSRLGLASSALMGATSLVNPVLAVNLFAMPHHVVLAAFSVMAIRSRSKASVWLFSGWSIYTVFPTLMFLYYFGLMGPSFLTSWGLALGNVALAICMACAIFCEKKQKEQLSFAQIQNNFKELANRDQIIQEYSSPVIVSEIMLGMDPRAYKSRWASRAILFSDIRNFTSLVEKAELSEVEDILGTYLGEIVECTFEFNGEVNKMLGDAALCIFDDAPTCLKSTVELRKRLVAINDLRVKLGRTAIRVGSGVAYSRVISMNVGKLGKRLDRTVIGDEVNIAARIETLTKELGVDVLISKKFHDEVPSYEFQRPLGSYLLKGKSAPTELYELFEHEAPEIVQYKLASVSALTVALQAQAMGDAREALTLLRAFKDAHPTPDRALDLLIKQLESYRIPREVA